MPSRTRSLLLAILLTVTSAGYTAFGQTPSDKPALIVGIVIDGMKYDWIERYWNLLGEGGIKKLIKQAGHDPAEILPVEL